MKKSRCMESQILAISTQWLSGMVTPLPLIRDYAMKNTKENLALSQQYDEVILKTTSDFGVNIVVESHPMARDANKIIFDSEELQDWPNLINQFAKKLKFQQTTNQGYDFGLDAFVDCMRDSVDEAEDGILLVFENSGKILKNDRKITLDRFCSAIRAVSEYAKQTIEDGEWWDREPRYFKIIFKQATPKTPGVDIIKKLK